MAASFVPSSVQVGLFIFRSDNRLPWHGGTTMLVLTRRPGEEIVIDGGIRVTVVAIGPRKVRLGITAPADVTVDRMEIHERRAQQTFQPKPTESDVPRPAGEAQPQRFGMVLASARKGSNP
jgi:carbon storage regulator